MWINLTPVRTRLFMRLFCIHNQLWKTIFFAMMKYICGVTAERVDYWLYERLIVAKRTRRARAVGVACKL